MFLQQFQLVLLYDILESFTISFIHLNSQESYWKSKVWRYLTVECALPLVLIKLTNISIDIDIDYDRAACIFFLFTAFIFLSYLKYNHILELWCDRFLSKWYDIMIVSRSAHIERRCKNNIPFDTERHRFHFSNKEKYW